MLRRQQWHAPSAHTSRLSVMAIALHTEAHNDVESVATHRLFTTGSANGRACKWLYSWTRLSPPMASSRPATWVRASTCSVAVHRKVHVTVTTSVRPWLRAPG